MRNRIVTAVKQRFSIRKLSIGAASVLLGTSLYFMGVSAPVVHAATNGETPASSETSTDSKDPVSVAGQSKYSDVDVNNAIDQYAEKNQDAVNEQEEKEKTGNKVIIRPSDKQPVTVYNTTDRKTQVENIIQKEINDGITKANQNWNKIQEYKKNHNDQQILNGTESDYFENQGLSIDDEKGSEINKITVTDDKDTTKTKDVDTKAVDGETKDIGEITKIADFDGIDITHTSNMTDKEREAMKVNSDNKVIVDFQPAQYQDQDKEIDKEITVTYDNLNNSYYLENINDETNRIKISRIDRTFSSIKVADNPHRFYGGWRGNKYDNYDPCNGPQLIIYNDPSDGFFYNNIEQISVKDIYYDDKGNPIKTGDNKTGDKNTAWIFVTSLNSNGGGNIEKVRAVGPDNSPVNAEKIAGSTVIDHNDGWWYSGSNNNFGTDPDWDNNDENNLFGFVGTVAFQYYPGMTLQYRADDSQWGSHWACMQTQVVSSLYTPVIIYDHIKDGYSRSDDVNMTVHYVMDDGSKASSDSKQTASFTESGIQDSVTGKITWTPAASGIQDNVTGKITWTPATSQTFEDVTTPAITGYTPDNDKVAGSTVKFGDKDIEVTVTYSPDKQHMTITYIDDTTGKTLHTDNPEGVSDQDAKYTTKHTIEQFEDQHYKLIRDSTNGKDLIFDHDDNVNQTYEVHFVHDTQKVNRKDTVTETINYKFEDGTTAQPTVTQTENFSEDGNKDLVTGKTTWDEATPQTFEDVTTPAISGYTPNKDKVTGSTVKFGDNDIEVTVTYSPDDQLGHINYIDDNTGKTLARDNFSGKTNGHENYTPTNRIQEFENKGYEFVSSDYPDGGFNFDDNDRQDQVFNVHLKHGTVTVTTKKPQTPNTPINPDPQSPKYPKDINNTNHDVKRTIDYKYSDGKTAQPTVTDSLHFERTVVIDKVTGEVSSDTWTPSQDFNDIQTPAIQGYTPDRTVVSDKNIGHDYQDIVEHVVYSPDKQHMTITYIDDTTGKTLHTDNPEGVSDQDAKYTTKHTIEQFEDQHYKLIRDSTNGKDLIFDHDDNVNQTYEVHFVHDTQKVNRKDTVTETINYKFEDGTTAQPTVTQTENFSEDGNKDLVTGKTTWDEATPQTFEDVTTPAISGYTPNKDKVTGSTVKFGDKDIEVTVTYHNNTQNAVITYIDDTEKKTLGSDKQDGKFDHEIKFEHDPAEVIKGLEEKGYKLVSDNFKPGIKYQNDNKLNIFEVHLVHTYEPVETSQTITETVHYIDANGKPVAPDHVAKVVIEVTGTRDKVTDSITWNTPSIGHFDEVISPEVPNMTPDKKLIPGRDVQYGDSDITENVVYTPDNPTFKTPKKPHKPNNPTPKTPKKSHKLGNPISKTPKKPHKPNKKVSKQSGTIVKTTITEKPIDSRTVDNHASAKSTAKRELPQTGATTNTGIWTGLVSMIASLGLLGASKKRKKN